MLKVLVVNVKGGCGKSTIATTIAGALANQGLNTTIADADKQRSVLDWSAARPADAAPVTALDWTKDKWIGDTPKKVSALIIDAPGSLGTGKLEDLVAEATSILVPVLPSAFDWGATRSFLEKLDDIKKVRKGRAKLHLIANRVRSRSRATIELIAFFDQIGLTPLAHVPDRLGYVDLATQGLTAFDRPQKNFEPLRRPFESILTQIADDQPGKSRKSK